MICRPVILLLPFHSQVAFGHSVLVIAIEILTKTLIVITKKKKTHRGQGRCRGMREHRSSELTFDAWFTFETV